MKKFNLLLGSFILFGLLIFGCSPTQELGETTTNSEPEVAREEPEKPEEQKAQESIEQLLVDGLYETQVQYESPAGVENLRIEFEIIEGVVQTLDFELIGEELNQVSQNKVQASEDGIKELLLGKQIEAVEIPDSVSGSSLTTGAFKNAVDSLIKNS